MSENDWEIVDQIEDACACYTPVNFVVWKRLIDGKLFYMIDDGYSLDCPFKSTEKLNEIDDIEALSDAVEKYRFPKEFPGKERCTLKRKMEFLVTVFSSD